MSNLYAKVKNLNIQLKYSTIMFSDVVVPYKVPRLFFVVCIGDTHTSVRYLMREEKERAEEGL